ncbi:MAG TPA: lasso peptide biosynthesis B2 protein [Vicinamibacterales bacterium]|nr:lasso peptide biosynthesis B2 protein [Vicinamibacterales bacterium]
MRAAAAITIAKLWLWIAPGGAVRWATQRSAGESSAAARAAAHAITALGSRFPLRASCLQQGLALVMWLSVARIPSRLVVGVARPERGVAGGAVHLHAHAWVECGSDVILGAARAAEFSPLPAVNS